MGKINIFRSNTGKTIVTEPLRRYLKSSLSNGFTEASELEKRRILRTQGYKLILPDNFSNRKMQEDGTMDCGILCLYAAMVANRYTPGIKDIIDQSEVRRAGLRIE